MKYTEDLDIDLKNIKSITVVKSNSIKHNTLNTFNNSYIDTDMIKGKGKTIKHPSLKAIWTKC